MASDSALYSLDDDSTLNVLDGSPPLTEIEAEPSTAEVHIVDNSPSSKGSKEENFAEEVKRYPCLWKKASKYNRDM